MMALVAVPHLALIPLLLGWQLFGNVHAVVGSALACIASRAAFTRCLQRRVSRASPSKAVRQQATLFSICALDSLIVALCHMHLGAWAVLWYFSIGACLCSVAPALLLKHAGCSPTASTLAVLSAILAIRYVVSPSLHFAGHTAHGLPLLGFVVVVLLLMFSGICRAGRQLPPRRGARRWAGNDYGEPRHAGLAMAQQLSSPHQGFQNHVHACSAPRSLSLTLSTVAMAHPAAALAAAVGCLLCTLAFVALLSPIVREGVFLAASFVDRNRWDLPPEWWLSLSEVEVAAAVRAHTLYTRATTCSGSAQWSFGVLEDQGGSTLAPLGPVGRLKARSVDGGQTYAPTGSPASGVRVVKHRTLSVVPSWPAASSSPSSSSGGVSSGLPASALSSSGAGAGDLPPKHQQHQRLITLVTHLTLDRVPSLCLSHYRWGRGNPFSAALYVTVDDIVAFVSGGGLEGHTTAESAAAAAGSMPPSTALSQRLQELMPLLKPLLALHSPSTRSTNGIFVTTSSRSGDASTASVLDEAVIADQVWLDMAAAFKDYVLGVCSAASSSQGWTTAPAAGLALHVAFEAALRPGVSEGSHCAPSPGGRGGSGNPSTSSSESAPHCMLYPINTLRNVAVEHSSRHVPYVFMLDADFAVSPDFWDHIDLESLRTWGDTHSSKKRDHSSSASPWPGSRTSHQPSWQSGAGPAPASGDQEDPRLALRVVVPFIPTGSPLFGQKRDRRHQGKRQTNEEEEEGCWLTHEQSHGGQVIRAWLDHRCMVSLLSSEQSHRYSDVWRWRHAKSPYQVQYGALYEPYVIGLRAALPPYPESVLYGGDRQIHSYMLASMGFTFTVLPGAYVIHETPRSEAEDGDSAMGSAMTAVPGEFSSIMESEEAAVAQAVRLPRAPVSEKAAAIDRARQQGGVRGGIEGMGSYRGRVSRVPVKTEGAGILFCTVAKWLRCHFGAQQMCLDPLWRKAFGEKTILHFCECITHLPPAPPIPPLSTVPPPASALRARTSNGQGGRTGNLRSSRWADDNDLPLGEQLRVVGFGAHTEWLRPPRQPELCIDAVEKASLWLRPMGLVSGLHGAQQSGVQVDIDRSQRGLSELSVRPHVAGSFTLTPQVMQHC